MPTIMPKDGEDSLSLLLRPVSGGQGGFGHIQHLLDIINLAPADCQTKQFGWLPAALSPRRATVVLYGDKATRFTNVLTVPAQNPLRSVIYGMTGLRPSPQHRLKEEGKKEAAGGWDLL
ncbi:hypothetical protein RRG08_030721 [Elysia crispata]|uniref:Uncharacterized protein n=1 Tax=Elysia crispata TaxID=231223 RepID=A0AAE1CSD0_9GAST|nr:hypothetical protein RRG08_030721 [Elysia crispata]